MHLQQSPAAPVPNQGLVSWGLDKQAAFFPSTERFESTMRDSQAAATKTENFLKEILPGI